MRTNQILKLAILVSFATVLASSCKKNQVADPPFSTPFSGISQANFMGEILSTNPDDWKPITATGLEFRPQCAYPNPCDADTGFALQWYVPTTDSISLTLNDSPEHVLRTFLQLKIDSGTHYYASSLSGLQPAIYRLYFSLIRPESTYVTYGDLQVN